MSNGEVKDADRGSHEVWCDTQNNISELCNCIASEYIEKIERYERIVSEKDAAYNILDDINIALNEKIATQKRVVEKLTEQRNRAANRHHKQSLNKYLERISKFEEEIKAIENGEL